jgi:hypothetical protein
MTPENIKDLKKIIHETIEENPSIMTLKSDMLTVKSDIKELKIETKRLGQEQFEMRALMDEMGRDIKLILDAVIPAQARANQVDRVAEKVEHHEYRIGAIETWITDRGTETSKS